MCSRTGIMGAVIFGDRLVAKSGLKGLELRLYKYFGGIVIAHGLGITALTVALATELRRNYHHE